jgi:type 1 glutamine amidotransferase
MEMSMILPLIALAMLPCAAPQDAKSEDVRPEKLSALIVTGENNHDWEWTHKALEELLKSSGLFHVEITTTPSAVFEDLGKASAYDVFVLDYNGKRWSSTAEANFLTAVEGGVGVAVIHAADNAFRGWTEYERLVSLLWRDGTGHGSFHSFDVKVTDRDHPITSTLPTLKAHPDELYHRLVHMHDSPHRVLATAFADPEKGGTGAHEPMIIVSNYGEGRVFHTPLGHVWRGREETHASYLDSQFQTLVLRGTEWAASGAVTDGDASPNKLSGEERRAGWQLLFDGESAAGWRGFKQDGFPEKGWEVIQGCLRHTKGGGSIITTGEYAEFDLSFEWKVASGANSGVKIWIDEAKGQLGPEYQVLDDIRHTNGLQPKTTAGALYDVLAPSAAKKLARVGSFNRSRIHSRGGVLEHYLNGQLVIRAELDSPEWETARTQSKFRGSPVFGIQRKGHILLQDHGDEVWFRSIKLRIYED